MRIVPKLALAALRGVSRAFAQTPVRSPSAIKGFRPYLSVNEDDGCLRAVSEGVNGGVRSKSISTRAG